MYRLFALSTLLFLFVSAEPRTPKIYNVLISTKKNLSPSHAVPVFEPVLRTTSLGVALPPLFYQAQNFAGYQPLVADNFERDGMLEGTTQGNEQQNIQDAQEALPAKQFINYDYNPYFVNTQGYYSKVTQEEPLIQQPQQIQSTQHPQYSLQQVEPQHQHLLRQQPQRLFQGQQQPQELQQQPQQLLQQPQQLLQQHQHLLQQPQQLLQQPPPQQYAEDPKTIVANLKRNPNIPDVPPPALPVRTTS